MRPISYSFTANGLDLNIWEHQKSSKNNRNFLFLHGYLDTSRSFDDLISKLPNHIDSFGFDFRGHGANQDMPPGISYHLLDHTKDLACVLKYLESINKKIDVIVAHSMSGNVALMTLGAKKFGVKKLTLLESLGAPPEEPEEQPDRLENFLNHILEINFNQNKDQNFKTFSSEQEARETLIKRNPGLSQVGAERMTRYALAYNGQTNNHKFKFNPALRGPSPVRFSENYWHALCSRVECPVTYFRAEHGFMPNSGKYAQRFEKFKQAKQINLPNMGHNIHVEDSFMERFVQELT